MKKEDIDEQAGKFLELFQEAIKVIPDRRIFLEWVIYSLGVLSTHASDTELEIIECAIWTMKQEIRH